MANNICINGQLLLIDLIEQIEKRFGDTCQLIQANTDGILVKLESPELYDKYVSVCKEWENQYVLRKNINPLTKERIYIKDLRKNLSIDESYKNIMTKRMIHLMEKRDNKIKYYIYKSSKMIIDYCLLNNINRIIIGNSKDFQNKGFVLSKEYYSKDNYSKHIEKEKIKKDNQKFLMILTTFQLSKRSEKNSGK